MIPSRHSVYHETQWLASNPLMKIFVGSSLLGALGLWFFCWQQPFIRQNPNLLIFLACLCFLMPAWMVFLASLQLHCLVDDNTVCFGFSCLLPRASLRLETIQQVDIIPYHWWHYGGWGWRQNKRLKRQSFATHGNYAIKITTHEQKIFIIGSQQTKKLQQILQQAAGLS